MEFIQILFGLVFIFVIMFILLGLFSKIFNVRVTSRFGDTVSTPDSLDLAYDTISSAIKKIKIKKPQTLKMLRDNEVDKLQKLKLLGDLRRDGVLTEEEFNQLKQEML